MIDVEIDFIQLRARLLAQIFIIFADKLFAAASAAVFIGGIGAGAADAEQRAKAAAVIESVGFAGYRYHTGTAESVIAHGKTRQQADLMPRF